MLKAEYYSAPTDIDLLVFEKLIPADHYLRRLKAAIDFEPLRALVADCYAVGMGAPMVTWTWPGRSSRLPRGMSSRVPCMAMGTMGTSASMARGS